MTEKLSNEVLVKGLTRGLTTILDRIDALEAKTSGVVVGTLETADVPAGETPPFTPDVPTTSTVETPTGELDKQNCPWDARINSTTKNKTAKDIFKRLRGIEDDFYNQVIAEIKVVGRDTSKDICLNVERTDGVAAAPTAPVVPAAPVAPTAPTAPVVPAAPVAPTAPTVTPRAELNEVLTKLTDHYGIDATKVVETAMKPFGGDTVSSLTDFDGALALGKDWVLKMQNVDKVDEYGESMVAEYDGVIIAGADHSQAIETALPSFYGSATQGAKRPQDLNYEDIDGYCSSVTKYLADYEAYLSANK